MVERGQYRFAKPKKQNGHIKREGKAWRSDSERKLDPGHQSIIIDVLCWQGNRHIWVCGTGLPATRDAGEQDRLRLEHAKAGDVLAISRLHSEPH